MAMKKISLSILITILAYSIVAFAYMHNTFTTKDVFELVFKRLDRIEIKVDKLIDRK